MTPQKMAEAAKKISENVSFSDAELRQCIDCTKLVLAYLASSRGFDLATGKVRRNLNMLENFAEARGWK